MIDQGTGAGFTWTEQELQLLIDSKTPESFELEYKDSRALDFDNQSDARKIDVAKQVSSLANANGGTLIYGIREDENKQFPVCIDGGVDPAKVSRDDLNNIITSRLSPKLRDYEIHTVILASSGDGRVAYVIEVQRTISGGPHQLNAENEKRYYRRVNTRLDKMEDYEIRDAMYRMSAPDLECCIVIGNMGVEESFPLEIKVENKAADPVLYANFEILIEDRLSVMSAEDLDESHEGFSGLFFPNVGYACSGVILRRSWVCPNDPPFWLGMTQSLTLYPMQLRVKQAQPYEYFATVVIRSPHMAPKYRTFSLRPFGGPGPANLASEEEFGYRHLLSPIAPA